MVFAFETCYRVGVVFEISHFCCFARFFGVGSVGLDKLPIAWPTGSYMWVSLNKGSVFPPIV